MPVTVRPSKVGPAEVGPGEVGPAEVGPAEVGPVEVGPAEVGPYKRRGPHQATLAQHLQLLLVLALASKGGVQRGPVLVMAEGQPGRVLAAAPLAAEHGLHRQPLLLEPGADRLCLGPASLGQVALGAALAQGETWRIAQTGFGARMADQQHAPLSGER